MGRLLARLGLVREGRIDPRPAILLSVGLTWLPLLVLSLLEGVAWGGGLEVPLLKDFLPYGQFLLAVPALVLAEVIIGKRLDLAAAELRRSDVLAPEATPALDRLLHRAATRWRGRAVHIVILVLTGTGVVASVLEVSEWLTGGWQYAGDQVTLPGWWYLLVSLPVLRFLELRWLWRLLVWAGVLWRTAHLRIQPRPAHPDRAGGLAFLGGTQAVFGWLVFAFGVQLSCLIADQVYFEGSNLMTFRAYVLAFVGIVVVGLLLPLLVFVPKLARARYENLLFLSGRGYDGAGSVDRLLRSPSDGALPSAAISGLTDYGVLFENARLMKPVPLEWRHVGALVLAAALPFLPLIFLVMPAQEVLQAITRLLI
ncbi:MAG: hypothetical protein KAJ13_09090 [Gemmatimonadetes bacterium]|nr:hypothetical protein [Gemmatimonadota bacterium]